MLLRLSLLHTWREKHYPEYKIMAAALFLAVFAISTLLILTQVMRYTIVDEASSLLGADLVIESAEPLNETYQQYATDLGISTATVIDFFSMLSANNKSELVAISAIAGDFPLRGKLGLRNVEGKLISHSGPPNALQVWVENTLALKLAINLGQSVNIGDATFTVDGILAQRPMALSEGTALAPVAYVNASDLSKMAVLQPGSRATYRLLLAGTQEQLLQYKEHFKNNDDVTWVSATQGRPAINRILNYSQRYLVVILLIQVLLAGVAIALCAHQYSLRAQKNVALWKSFGAVSGTIIRLHFISLCILAFFILMLAISASYMVAIYLLKSTQFAYAISQISWQGGALGGASGLIILLGFALGPLWSLKQVSPIRLLQRQPLPTSYIGWISSLIAFGLLALLFNLYLQESEVALRLGIQIVILSALAFALAYLLWNGFGYLSRTGSLSWRFGVAYMVRHKSNSIMQWFVFMLVVMLLLLLHIIQKDFIESWKAELPTDTPNYFLINIQSNQVEPLQKWFDNNNLKDVHFYPIVRGRLSHINGVRVEEINQSTNEKKGLQRSLNLTWMKDLPADNNVISGENWQNVKEGQAVISIEQRFGERQNLKLGDTISFQIAENAVTGKIIQIRTVQWESFKPNFFVIFPPKVLDNLPHSYITSVYLPADKKQNLIALTKDYVEISLIDIESLLTQAREVINKITTGIQTLIILVFTMGILIMYASILSCLKERLTESAMLQILGANKRFITKVLCIEFGVLGLLSGLVGSIIAYIIAQDLAKRFFEFPLHISYNTIVLGVVGSILAILIFGLIGTRKVFRISPMWLLKQN